MISLKTEREIALMRDGGRLLSRILKAVSLKIAPGVMTLELDKEAESLILNAGAQVAFRGYQGFPGTICVSLNDEVVHAAPSKRTLREGDIITLDMGLIWKGYYVDMARTFPVGAVDPDTLRLMKATRKALRLGIRNAKVGNTFGDIGNAVQRFVEDQGYNVVRDLCGHGIGKELHQEPQVPNYGKRHTGPEIQQGMVFCIEPMVTEGDWRLKKSRDGFGFVTKDGSLSCHIEDTIAMTKKGPEVLTV